MSQRPVTLALPTADRPRAHAFFQALGFETPGEMAEDGVPEPLQVVVSDGLTVMFVPTGGFAWVTAGRETATPGTAECLISLPASQASDVDDLVARAGEAGGDVASAPQQKPWGYSGTFADPDGHLWESVVREWPA